MSNRNNDHVKYQYIVPILTFAIVGRLVGSLKQASEYKMCEEQLYLQRIEDEV